MGIIVKIKKRTILAKKITFKLQYAYCNMLKYFTKLSKAKQIATIRHLASTRNSGVYINHDENIATEVLRLSYGIANEEIDIYAKYLGSSLSDSLHNDLKNAALRGVSVNVMVDEYDKNLKTTISELLLIARTEKANIRIRKINAQLKAELQSRFQDIENVHYVVCDSGGTFRFETDRNYRKAKYSFSQKNEFGLKLKKIFHHYFRLAEPITL